MLDYEISTDFQCYNSMRSTVDTRTLYENLSSNGGLTLCVVIYIYLYHYLLVFPNVKVEY